MSRPQLRVVSKTPRDFRDGRVGQIVSYTLNDLVALRRDITRETTELGNAVAMSTTLDAATREQWRQTRQRVVDWLSDEPSWFRADGQYRRGLALQKDLAPWHDRLRAPGVTPMPPSPAPTPPTPGLLSPAGFAGFSFEGLGPLLLLLGFAYAFGSKGRNGR